MTLSKDHGDLVFECNTCEATLTTNQAQFSAAMTLGRRNGWKAIKRGSVWEHACPKCQKAQQKPLPLRR